MTQAVQIGTILIADEPQLAQVFAFKSEPYSGKWHLVQGLDGVALDRQLHAAGWSFFFLAAEVKARFFGASGTHRIRHALQRILKKVGPENFNCLEVTGIVARSFLGMPYTTVSAHSRHIQQSCRLDDIETRQAAQ